MKTTIVLLALALPLVGLLLGGCPSGVATVEELCQTTFDCFDNNWGWTDQANCEDQWLTGCVDEEGYLACTGACVAGTCEGFATENGEGCEPDCWAEYCE